jgi:hypothetical protein
LAATQQLNGLSRIKALKQDKRAKTGYQALKRDKSAENRIEAWRIHAYSEARSH